MLAIYAAITALFASTVRSAPTTSLDPKVFLQNGMTAQALNAKFSTLKASDSCNDSEMACVVNSIAHCANSTWKLEACPKSLACFALPSVREQGTTLSCTSNVTALSLINASGATGGIAANSTDDSVKLPMDCDGDDASDDSTDDDSDDSTSTETSNSSTDQSITTSARSANPTGTQKATSKSTSTVTSTSTVFATPTASDSSTDGAAPTVTITVTVGPDPTSTPALSSDSDTTVTLNRSQASSILSSILNDPNASATIINSGAPNGTGTTTTVSASATDSATNEKPSGSTQPAIVSPTFITGTPSGTNSSPSTPSTSSEPAIVSPILTTIHRSAVATGSGTSSSASATAAAAADSDGYGY